MIEADPETAEQRRLDQAAERFVRTARPEHGHTMLYARLDAGDAIAFTSMCDRVARLLRDQGDDAPMDVLRSRAVGWLGTPLRAAALLAGDEPRPPLQRPRCRSTRRPTWTGYLAAPLDALRPACRWSRSCATPGAPPGRGFRSRDAAAGGRSCCSASRVTVTPVVDLRDLGRRRLPVAVTDPRAPSPCATRSRCSRTARCGCRDVRTLDHVVPYDPGGPPGQTSTTNLAPLARGHHRVRDPRPRLGPPTTRPRRALLAHGPRALGRRRPPPAPVCSVRRLPTPDQVLLDDTATPPERGFAAMLAA